MKEHPLNALPQGYRLQEYELVRVLGLGGFGVTYLGYDHNLDKAVAIKEYQPADIAIRTENQSIAPKASTFREDYDWGLERFLDEARTLARFDHRNIVKVHRYFEANGTAYIVMEYAEGQTLASYLSKKGTLNEAELKTVLMPILDGLETVHGADFLHRDIKPGNIVLRDEDSSSVLVDFGAARHAVSVRSHSVTTIVTPGYAPIEQYSSRGNQGPWTDIYALGAVCYKALTGDTPVDSIDRLTDDSLVPLVERNMNSASLAFLQSIDLALQVKEAYRPQNVVEWNTAIVEGAPTATENDPLVEIKYSQNSSPRDSKPFDWVRLASYLVIAVYFCGLLIQDPIVREKANREVPSYTLGSHVNEVLWLQGIPVKTVYVKSDNGEIEVIKFQYDRREDMKYESRDEVDIDYRTKKVVKWYNKTGKLRVSIVQGEHFTLTSSFTLGSHQDAVIRLHGTPTTAMRVSDKISWRFESASGGWVSIDSRTRQVIGWSNYDGGLKVKMEPGAQVSGMPHFTLGSHQDDVVRLQGTPVEIENQESKESWYYEVLGSYRSRSGSNTVSISQTDRKVVGWSNRGSLKVRLDRGEHVSQSSHFTLGSHRDDVIRLQGTPKEVEIGSQFESWTYDGGSHFLAFPWEKGATVILNRESKNVVNWDNGSGRLNVRMQPGDKITQLPYFTRGSHQDDVLRLQGTPSSIEFLSDTEKIWDYEESTVKIDRETKKVTGWDNTSKNLLIRTQPRKQ